MVLTTRGGLDVLGFLFCSCFQCCCCCCVIGFLYVIATGRDLVHSIQLGGVLEKKFVDSLQRKKKKYFTLSKVCKAMLLDILALDSLVPIGGFRTCLKGHL